MPESRLSLDRRLVSSLLVTVCRLLTGIRSRWHSEPEPEKTRIYYANHSSHLDGLVIWASLPPQMRTLVHPVAAADYWLGSRLRRYLALRIFGAVLVERRPAGEREEGSPSTSKDVLLPLKQALDGQHSLILFPEGTRGSGEQLNSFKSGLYHLSKAYPQVELVPVWLDNLNRVLPKGSRLVVPIICSATFGTPLPGVAEGEDKQAFLARTKAALEAIAP
ncbi:lysophospholipid acyltransferase family protein [Pantoea coffeiphila]|uniref:1-acyl-sn-glycerol-3-phosphate acyltransferase n=1 Tax=Pantoea coffeiphila TaxID=1465635 RepID=A0A2S9I3M0_9GAMM|nr:lysophospholipid acyltransferase family protein [Pantoea coffeiphila]PRD12389.1 1-acyl-sn-glycerol-3-phosphate acyltransferase [Pantoea coffeiphila]